MPDPALQLDIVIDQDGSARRAVAEFAEGLRKAGVDAETSAKQIDAFEKEYTEAAKAAKKASDEQEKAHTKATGAANTQSQAMSGLTSAIIRYAGPSALALAAKKTIEWADSVEEASQRTRLSTTYVQQLTKTAEKNGTTFATMANLIQANEQRLASGNKNAIATLDKLGLSIDHILSLNAEERFREQAKALAMITDPAQRSAAEMALFGRAADGAANAMNAVAAGADKVESALGPDFIRVGAQAQAMWENLTNAALQYAKAAILAPTVAMDKLGNWAKDSTIGTAFEMMGLHGSRASQRPGLVGTPAGANLGMPSPLGVPGDPFAVGGVGGNSMEHIIKSLQLAKTRPGASGSASPWSFNHPGLNLPMTPWQFGGIGVGQFPGWAPPPVLAAGGSPIGFMNGMQLPGTVGMNAPGGGGGGFMNFLKGRGGQMAGMGLGLLGNLIPGMSGTGSSLGAMAGSFFGPLGSGIGSLLGGAVGGLFGGGQGRRTNDVRDAYTDKMGGTQALAQLAQEAGTNLDAFFKADTVKEFESAVSQLEMKFSDLTAHKDQVAGLKSEIELLTEQTTVGFDQMNAVAREFGIDVSKLGPAFQQQKLDQEAQRITDALAIMERGGADMSGVLSGMSDEFSTLVQDSIRAGLTLPENLQPYVNQLAASGQLLDENGQKITDTSRLKFSGSLQSSLDTFVSKLEALILKLAGVETKFNDAKGAAEDFAATQDGINLGGPVGEPAGVSRGGIIGGRGKLLYFKHGGFVPRGTDSVPAMLTPGEMVISRDMVKSMAKNGGGGGRTVVNHFHISGFISDRPTADYLADVVSERLDRQFDARRAG